MDDSRPTRAPLPAAILLDLDDTLLNFSSGADACWEAACARFAGELGSTSPHQLVAAIHRYRDWYWGDPERHRQGRLDLAAARRAIVAGALSQLGFDLPLVAEGVAAAYIAARDAGLCLFPDAVETLARLREAGVRLALVTNGRAEDQRAKIERFALAPWFQFVLIEGEFGIGKPDERVYRHALQQLGVPARAAWMVGDNLEWDVAGPQRVGMTGIWHDVAGAGLPSGSAVRPDRVIRRISELLEPG
jgi:putative hydrolase of the HAD superfamily